MAGLGSLLSGIQRNTLFQIAEYGVAQTVLGGLLAPEADALSQTVYQANPVAILTPAEAAAAVMRNLWPMAQGEAEALRSGINAERFRVLTGLAGNAPGPGDLAVALRRKLISPDRYLEGIRQGLLRDEWAELPKQLAVVQPSPEAMLAAYLEGQLSEAEARKRYAELGGDPDYFTILFHTQGQAPTPVQAADMANRGLIPWAGTGPDAVSFEQAFLEGPWRNKWLEPFKAAAQYFPPPRTITAMYREGSLSRAQAMHYLQAQGLTEELAAAYLKSGSDQKTAATKDLARTTVTQLYGDRLISRDQAGSFLEGLGYDAEEAGFILAIEDARLVQRYLGTAVGRIHTLYVGHKITRQVATATLARLELAANQVDDLVGLWDYERAATVRTLTPSEIASGYKLGLLTLEDAQGRLEELGYQPHDAWLYLSIHTKGPVTETPPAPDAIVPGPTGTGG
jgi:hypothetical protein